ncbi:hypothetical protein BJ912DRAFT_862094, partial [Pholiota molesta]
MAPDKNAENWPSGCLDTPKISGSVLKQVENPGPSSDLTDDANLTVKRARTGIYEKQKALRIKLIESDSPAAHWRIIKNLLGSKDTPSDFSPDDLRQTFEARMNPIIPTPLSFDAEKLKLDRILAEAIPDHTVDVTPEHVFSRSITSGEVKSAKVHLRKKSTVSA